MVFWRAWYSALVHGLRGSCLCCESKLAILRVKDVPCPCPYRYRYPKRSGRSLKLKLWKARGNCPVLSGIRSVSGDKTCIFDWGVIDNNYKAVLLGGFGHLVTKRGPKNISESLLMAGFPSFGIGFLLATILYAGCLTLPELITAMSGTVKLRIYSNSVDNYHQVPLRAGRGRQLVNDAFFKKDYPTVFYFHGFTETPSSLSVSTVVQALLSVRPQVNVVVVDWSKIAAHEFYPIPALMTAVLGRRVARQIDRWIKSGALSISGLRLVGHSLGAQFAGFTAKAIKRGRVPFLVGLDPAYPGFFVQSAVQLHISQYDADMVTIIHTDAGVYGIPYDSGWADFYPNGGTRIQPGCPANTTLLSDDDFCSHWRAWQIFAESLTGGDFVAVHCESYADFLSGRCRDNYQTRLDFFQPPSSGNKKIPRGSYYFRTESKDPFAMGPLGAQPPDSVDEREVDKPMLPVVDDYDDEEGEYTTDEIADALNETFKLL